MSMWGTLDHELENKKYLRKTPSYNEKEFIAMFTGLVDGDGYIEIGPQKQYQKNTKILRKSTIRARLVIRLHSRDNDLLKYISEYLKTGSLSSLSKENQIRLIFSKRDLINVIIPLMEKYNVFFLNENRKQQYTLLNYIINNNITHWDEINERNMSNNEVFMLPDEYLKLDFFLDWIVGFTIAEGSFFFKSDGSAHYQIKQKGLYNYNIIKAICLGITGREMRNVKPDKSDCYQLSLSSKSDVNKVLYFFSLSRNISLLGYKYTQYEMWISNLKKSSRYKDIDFFNQ